ncbi:MAG TPA: hypothetical protein PKE27_20205 [Povalibacter sp.]|uniref:hypothetical protein n=1 Tax=Povalibacter sp. TaxID=1962978 RepID=UPI002C6BAFE7|nr:hypothetical protein [Povalibacter sp.]HMN46910.1 hypothetical protein [Povalibacter sp.]
MRADLLALTPDDLTSFSNRGLTRRAEHEASAGTLTCSITEDADGTVIVRWSDEVECRLPAAVHLTESRCTCPATTLCRHILRSIFAYQIQYAARPDDVVATRETPPATGWNPATITDEQLAACYPPAQFQRWQREFAAGHVIQLWTGTKPRALIHTLGCTVNFLVPHDLRYAACDCAAEAVCGHVALAVWAFRRLDADAATGLISTIAAAPLPPTGLLDEIERDLVALAGTGLARTAPLQVDRWRRLAERARTQDLVWPAEVLHELAESHAAYLARDARFDPREFTALLAELMQRLDAIRAARTPVPHLFVRGTQRDRETEFGSARLIGIGCSVRTTRSGTEIAAHLQDSDSGTITAITRRFAHAADQTGAPPKPFFELARNIALKGASFAAIGRGQLLIKGGRRTPSGRLVPGRAAASVAPQSYAWETLRAPLRTSGFAQTREQLRDAAPAALGPRQAGTRLTVCPVAQADGVRFDVTRQETLALLTDPLGEKATLLHPYVSRAASGSENLFDALRAAPGNVRFVCGHAELRGATLVIQPLSVIFDDNGQRSCIQPWTDEPMPAATGSELRVADANAAASLDPLHDYLDELLDCLAERWLTGPARSSTPWSRLMTLGTSLGVTRLADLAGIDEPARLLEVTVVSDFAYREFTRLSG